MTSGGEMKVQGNSMFYEKKLIITGVKQLNVEKLTFAADLVQDTG